MEMCVIYNPAAARGRTHKRIEALRQALDSRAEFRPTKEPLHAEELAFQAAQSGFAVVAAAGGDGTVHEVANGLLRANRPEVTFGLFPLGSANDYAFTLGIGPETGLNPDSWKLPRAVDVGIIRAENGRERFFVNCLGLGFNSQVTIEARRIRWLQGVALYGWAFVKALAFRYSCPIMEIRLDDLSRKVPTFALSVVIGKREGNLVVAPNAIPDDGWFDYLHAGALSRFEVLRYLPRLATGGDLPKDHPLIWQGRCREVTLQSEVPLTVHLDG
ncbi:MAG TPA: diacylglycerol kinase family protein, partial [Gemmataceae bacterium]|nr:diacylglycerol kinase family protein [Gemmataceae bacterium]